MNQWKKLAIFSELLLKRIFLRPAFWVFCALLFGFCVGIIGVSKSESSIAEILIVCDEEQTFDSYSRLITEKMLSGKSVFSYRTAPNEEEALAQLKSGQVDAVYYFSQNMDESFQNFLKGNLGGDKAVVIYEREETILLRLAKEELCALLYSEVAYEAYKQYIRKECGYSEIEEEVLRTYYDMYLQEGNLFQIQTQQGDAVSTDSSGMLTYPLRGLLSLFVVFIGFSGLLFFRRDVQQGVYDYLPRERRFGYMFLSAFLPELMMGIGVILILCVTGNGIDFGREVLTTCAYILSSTLFCVLIASVFRRLDQLSVVMPIVMLLLLLLSPIFFSIPGLTVLQYGIPTFYYLHSITRNYALTLELVYIAILSFVLFLWNNRFVKVHPE